MDKRMRETLKQINAARGPAMISDILSGPFNRELVLENDAIVVLSNARGGK